MGQKYDAAAHKVSLKWNLLSFIKGWTKRIWSQKNETFFNGRCFSKVIFRTMMKVLAFENNLVETSGQEQRKGVKYCLLQTVCVGFSNFFLCNQSADWSWLLLRLLLLKLFFYYECRWLAWFKFWVFLFLFQLLSRNTCLNTWYYLLIFIFVGEEKDGKSMCRTLYICISIKSVLQQID